jgi:hypothetical protein
MFRELHFIATGEDGSWLALWSHRPGLPLTRAPIVKLDTEGQLSCVAATLADYLVRETEEPDGLIRWFTERDIDVARDFGEALARCRFEPNPQGRYERMMEGEPLEGPVRNADPVLPEDLLGMHGEDERARVFVMRIERRERPLELKCDFAGRISTLWLKPENLAVPLEVRGVALGGPVAALKGWGRPTRTGKTWQRWDEGDVAVHVEHDGKLVQKVTLMYRPSLPDHLR